MRSSSIRMLRVEHVRDESVRERRLFVQRPHHLALVNLQHGRRHQRRCGGHPERLPCQATLTEEVTWREHGHDRLPAPAGQDRQPHSTLLDVEDTVRLGALREDD